MPPTLSIVIASVNGRPYIDDCLASLAKQRGDVVAEVIVVDCVGPAVLSFVRAEYPDVRLIAFSERKSVAKLRAVGILAACGKIVAVTEDHCLAHKDWYEKIIEAHQEHSAIAIGGAVDNGATERLMDWAVYLCEYSNFTTPVPRGVVHDLPAPNVSYKCLALELMGERLAEGYFETFFHQQLAAAGYDLWSEPSIMVWHKKHFGWRDFLGERFHYGRWFAGTRNKHSSLLQRLFHLLFSPFLPPLLLIRLTRRVLRSGQHLDKYLKALPLIAIFTMVWAAGEFVGYLLGPGESLMELS